MVHVLCFGNLWQGDDGFGIHVYRRLQQVSRQGSMRVFEVGLRGLDALSLFDDCDLVILVDALHEPESPAGTVRVLDAARVPPDSGASGAHGAGVSYLLQALAATGRPAPAVTLVGAVAAAIVPFVDTLSSAMVPAVDAVVCEVLRRVSAGNDRMAA